MKLGRRRVLTSPTTSAPKRRRNGGPELESINIIESLPQDLLVKVMCRVDFCDLKHLNLVSTTFCAAAKVAKDIHPSYCTPIKQEVTNMENYKDTPDVVVRSVRHSYSYSPPEKDISAVAVVLFENDEDYLN
ncbi:hypothetical protein LUZ60_011743 [Juncus effusus]|nr:hypothetical protein LUZ60_011743 [Juncus effusus]